MPFLVPLIVPVFVGAGATAGVALFAAQATVMLIQVGASIGLTIAAQALFAEKPKSAKATNERPDVGPATPRVVCMGRVATAGQWIFDNVFGSDNRQLQMVFKLSDFTIRDVTNIIIDGRRMNLSSSGPSGSADDVLTISGVPKYSGLVEIRVHLGSESQTADNVLDSQANPTSRWTSNHRGRGMAYVVLKLSYRQKVFPGASPPNVMFELRGAPLYDPRADSTQPGGSGSCRYNNQATWLNSAYDNPILQMLNFLLGFYRNGVLWVGAGLSFNEIDIASFMTAASVCDSTVSVPSGGTRPRYLSHIIAEGGRNSDPRKVIQSCLNACAGGMAIKDGRISVWAGAAKTPVATFTDDDIVLGDTVYSPKRGPDQGLFNTVIANYMCPTKDWNMAPVQTYKDAALFTEDGGERIVNFDYDNVTDIHQARNLMRIAFKASRFQASADITLTGKWLALECGDWVTWTSAKYGFTKTFEVGSKKIEWQTLACTFHLQETDTTVYGADTLALTPATSIWPDDGVLSVSPASFAVAMTTITGAGGRKKKMVADITWTPPDDETIDGIYIQWRRQGGSKIVDDHFDYQTVLLGAVTTSKGLGVDSVYEWRARWIRHGDPDTPTWTSWIATSSQPGDDAGVDTSTNANRLFNSFGRRTTNGWLQASNTTALTWTLGRNLSAATQLLGGNTFYLSATGTPTAGQIIDMANNNRSGEEYPVEAGESYEVSALIGVVACNARAVIRWEDDTGAVLSTSVGTVVLTTPAGGKKRADYGKLFDTFVAPANAATARIAFRATMTGAANPRLYVAEPYFGDLAAGQTVRSKWSQGQEELVATEVDTSQLATDSVSTVKVQDNAITQSGSNYDASQVSIPAGATFQQIKQFNVSRTLGTKLKGRYAWSMVQDIVNTADIDVVLRIYRGGTILYTFTRSYPVRVQTSGGYQIAGDMFADWEDDSLTVSGSTNYSFEMQGSGGVNLAARRRWSEFVEFKK